MASGSIINGRNSRMMEGNIMKSESINQWVAMAANLGVVLGLMFLGLELNQNNNLNRANAINSLFSSGLTLNDNLAINTELANVLAKANNNETLSGSEYIQFQGFIEGGLQRIWFDYQQINNGLITKEEFSQRIPRFKFFVQRFPFITDYWPQHNHNYAPQFNQFMEQCVFSECENVP
jgi:hypothetical protein